MRAAGLDVALSQSLSPWRKPLAVHDPAKVVLDVAAALALGGDCLADIAVVRAEPAVFGLVASDPTVSRTIDALAKDAPSALIDAKHPLVIDLDATLVTAHSDKEQAAPTFKRGFGHHPLWAFLDHGPAHGLGDRLQVEVRRDVFGAQVRGQI